MISAVRTYRLSVPLHTPFVTALRRTDTTDTVVVEIEDADGARGYGEAPAVWQVTGESLASAKECIDGPLSALVTGRDPDDLVALLRDVSASVVGNAGAKAAVDIALHDLAARRLDVSLPRFLGATAHEVPTDVTLAAADATALPDTTNARISDGFGIVKMKVGTDAATDVERVRAVREAAGPDVRIRLDANQGWTPREAVSVIGALEDARLDVELIEQPVAAADLDGLAWVTDRVATPIMADESLHSIRDLVELIRRRAVDMVNVKLAKCGGLRTARTLLEVAHSHGVGTMVGSMMETHVGVGAAASLVAAYPTTVVNDLDAAWWAAESPYSGGLHYERSTIVLPRTPGLGIDGVNT
ncbi:dipeptide epimerase [Nocardioidaceae bacterium SCSIO 66511]|nr:dipeptide epimerase [Nocardioidaceae bacterium SCSIO 66511]